MAIKQLCFYFFILHLATLFKACSTYTDHYYLKLLMKRKSIQMDFNLLLIDPEKAFIELTLIGAFNTRSKIHEALGKDLANDETIAMYFDRKAGDKNLGYKIYTEQYTGILQEFKKYLTDERLTGFDKDNRDNAVHKFYSWYQEQGDTEHRKCCYCGVKETDSNLFFNKKFPLEYPNKRNRGIKLEIERIADLKEHGGYIPDNMRLACHICNNAKSDFVSPKQFKPIALGIHNFWKEQGVTDIQFPDGEIWKHTNI